jgi:carbonic anhydrase
MEKILAGVRTFQSEVFPVQRERFAQLAKGQNPLALMITCSDSRINPSLLTQTEPGELFVLRNAGNLVPPHGTGSGGEAATIEYAVSVLGVEHIIVCGHSHCGAMHGLLDPDAVKELPSVSEWLRHAEPTRRLVRTFRHRADHATCLAAAVEANVLAQLDNLQTFPGVQRQLARNALQLHGWVYEFETGDVSRYDPDTQAFSSHWGPVPVSVPEGVSIAFGPMGRPN